MIKNTGWRFHRPSAVRTLYRKSSRQIFSERYHFEPFDRPETLPFMETNNRLRSAHYFRESMRPQIYRANYFFRRGQGRDY